MFIVYLVYNVSWYTYAIFNYPYMFNRIFNILVIFSSFKKLQIKS